MTVDRNKIKYVPGTYAQKRPDAAELVRKKTFIYPTDRKREEVHA
jgi:hypothetical protein